MEGTHQREAIPRKRGILGSVLEIILIIVVALVLAWVIKSFVIRPYEVPSGSMETTIMPKDYILSERVSYYFRDVERGDIVTFENPMLTEAEARSAEDRYLVKRVIATEGQTLDLIDGVVYVDGVALDEPYAIGRSWALADTFRGANISYPYTVPEGCIWVMGDNREHSSDSRYFGAVETSRITGHACCTYWPVSRIGVLR